MPLLDMTKTVKRWVDPYAVQNVDEDFPDPFTGKPTVGYLSYRLDTKTNSVKSYTFRITADEAMRLNIPSPKDTQPSFPQEVAFPCREIDPATETLATGFGGIEVRNIVLYNNLQASSDKSGFTNADRAILNQILMYVKPKT